MNPDPDNYVVLTDNYGVRDVNRAKDNEVLSLLVEEPPGHPPHFIDGSVENVLLYLHELKEFLNGEQGALLCNDPHITVQPTTAESVYRIRVGDQPVESMPHQSDEVLEAVQAAIEEDDLDPIIDVYKEILNSQVRREVVNDLIDLLDVLPAGRIQIRESGWLIDQYYLVDWTASVYTVEDDRDSPDYRRSGDTVEVTDKSKEFVELNVGYTPEEMLIRKPDGSELILGEREMLFIAKVKWLLDRTQYHQDEPFWRFNENRRKEYLQGDDQ